MNQRSIYDVRYRGDRYDGRSAVRVLTAEAAALRAAVTRAAGSITEPATISLFDFGYGTGRVTNDFAAVDFPRYFGGLGRDLHVIAYDVSAVGLSKGAEWLRKNHGFELGPELDFDMAADAGYVAGSAKRISGGTAVRFTFVHGNETEDSDLVGKLVGEANCGGPVSVTTSWYSALSHIPSTAKRSEFFRMLSQATDPSGELLVAPSVSGDLVELQECWRRRRLAGDIAGYPIEIDGDVIYETEMSQSNFWHVFGEDLGELLAAHVGPGQCGWLEAIRLPDEEFQSAEEEQANYERVCAFNQRVGRRRWTPADYRAVHTAVAIRSGSPVLEANCGWIAPRECVEARDR